MHLSTLSSLLLSVAALANASFRSPTSGVQWAVGQEQTIEYDTTGLSGLVDCSLVPAGATDTTIVIASISTQVENSGSIKWTPDKSIISVSSQQVSIIITDQNKKRCSSDSFLLIAQSTETTISSSSSSGKDSSNSYDGKGSESSEGSSNSYGSSGSDSSKGSSSSYDSSNKSSKNSSSSYQSSSKDSKYYSTKPSYESSKTDSVNVWYTKSSSIGSYYLYTTSSETSKETTSAYIPAQSTVQLQSNNTIVETISKDTYSTNVITSVETATSIEIEETSAQITAELASLTRVSFTTSIVVSSAAPTFAALTSAAKTFTTQADSGSQNTIVFSETQSVTAAASQSAIFQNTIIISETESSAASQSAIFQNTIIISETESSAATTTVASSLAQATGSGSGSGNGTTPLTFTGAATTLPSQGIFSAIAGTMFGLLLIIL